MTLTVLVLLGGFGNRFQENYSEPKPFIPVMGKSQLFWASKGAWLSYRPDLTIFAARTQLMDKLQNEVKHFSFLNEFEIVDIGLETQGPAETAFRALKFSQKIDLNSTLVIVDNDCFNLNSDFETKAEGSLPFVTIVKSVNPQHCFVTFDSAMYASAFHEKKMRGEYAISGNYGFENLRQFESTYNQLIENVGASDELFISRLMQLLVGNVRVRLFPVREYFSLGTPAEIEKITSEILYFQ